MTEDGGQGGKKEAEDRRLDRQKKQILHRPGAYIEEVPFAAEDCAPKASQKYVEEIGSQLGQEDPAHAEAGAVQKKRIDQVPQHSGKA